MKEAADHPAAVSGDHDERLPVGVVSQRVHRHPVATLGRALPSRFGDGFELGECGL